MSWPPVAILRPLGPVVFERFRPGALVDAPMGRLIGFMRHHPLGVLQMHHPPGGDGLFRRDNIFAEIGAARGDSPCCCEKSSRPSLWITNSALGQTP